MTENFKKSAVTWLKQRGLYQRLKASWVYDLYWTLADRQLLVLRSAEEAFYRSTLAGFKKGGLIIDVGANQGYKTGIFLRLGARVVAVDPDPANRELLRQKFLQYRLIPKSVVIEDKAVSEREGVMTLWMDAPGSAKNTLNSKWVDILRKDEKRFGQRLGFAGEIKVKTTTLDQLMETHGAPFYIKIDVEGHEPSVLRGLKSPVPYLSFEVNLPDFREEGMQCIQTLGEIFPAGEFNYITDCRDGLKCQKWLPQREFTAVFEQCAEATVEVYWRTGSHR